MQMCSSILKVLISCHQQKATENSGTYPFLSHSMGNAEMKLGTYPMKGRT